MCNCLGAVLRIQIYTVPYRTHHFPGLNLHQRVRCNSSQTKALEGTNSRDFLSVFFFISWLLLFLFEIPIYHGVMRIRKVPPRVWTLDGHTEIVQHKRFRLVECGFKGSSKGSNGDRNRKMNFWCPGHWLVTAVRL